MAFNAWAVHVQRPITEDDVRREMERERSYDSDRQPDGPADTSVPALPRAHGT